LPGGSYNILVTAKGFQKYSATGVVLDVAQKIRVDIQLTVGAITEIVEVTGESVVQVETQSSELSGTVTGKQIDQLVLNGRNFTQLVNLVPGVVNQTARTKAPWHLRQRRFQHERRTHGVQQLGTRWRRQYG